MKKELFLGFLQGDVFREMKAHLQRDAMKVFSSLVYAHRSRNEPSNVRDGDCSDDDKLLCNSFKYGSCMIFCSTIHLNSISAILVSLRGCFQKRYYHVWILRLVSPCMVVLCI